MADHLVANPGAGRYVRWFSDISLNDIALVGGKNASLGEMYRFLRPAGVLVPNGFAVTAQAYRDLLTAAGAWTPLEAILRGVDKRDLADLARRGARARELVYEAGIPAPMRAEIVAAYAELQAEYGPQLSVAVRSSATAEDLPQASFAGQHDSFLNIRGPDALIEACRRCFASIFTDRAISYRIDQGFDHLKVALSIAVMKMVRSDRATSGVMFSIDTESGFEDVVFITGTYGLGENIVKGAVDADEFYVHKPTYAKGHRAVLRRMRGEKQIKMIYARGGKAAATRDIATPRAERERFCLSDDEVLRLAGDAITVEAYYSQRAGRAVPMDVEWAKDGLDGKLYIIQARPETVVSQRRGTIHEEYLLKGSGPLLASGRAVGTKIASGRARIVASAAELAQFQPGDVLIADTTSPDWEPILKRASAVVTTRGSRTCHAAIVARELGIPAVVGAARAAEKIAAGAAITVSCAQGEVGHIYAGVLDYEVRRTDLGELARPRIKIMLNVGNPEAAFKTRFLPNDGVGLARMEFIINEQIKAHPLALLNPHKIASRRDRRALERLIKPHTDGGAFFVERLAEGIGTIAAAFYPKPVVVRLSDFKSNEYAALIGGAGFEPREENPMLGFRGAARYTHPDFAAAFALECAAIKRVREEMGLDNVVVMIPFVRRVAELDATLALLADNGLARGHHGLKIYAMCEIPNNVILIDEFAPRVDGYSIGSNDLTQLTLGVDRDSALVAFDYDERDAGVMELIRLAVAGCKRHGIYSGICGQAPSDYPEMVEFLVGLGIDSISLNPDAVLRTTRMVLAAEAKYSDATAGRR